MNTSRLKRLATSRAGTAAAVTALAAGATALWVQRKATTAEREHPPTGQRLRVDGVDLHYVERGTGPVIVLLHGNTVTLADFVASGLFDRLARTHRVIAFDRPGFGHSDRPRDRLWTPAAQAALLVSALDLLGVDRAAVLGHSMGASVALAMGLDHPERVRQLVLLSGYHFPTVRFDALLTAPVALPILGDALRYTVTALAARMALKGAVKGMFSPLDVPPAFFATVSRELMLRPSQIGANAEDAAFMMPAAESLAARHAQLRMPLTLIAGADDRIVDPQAHSGRLHEDIPHSQLTIVPGCGHMVHYVAAEEIAAALTDAATNDVEGPAHAPTPLAA